jgi:ABC-type dipeptide/oligopeptide/nickel transport system ATPase component
VTGPLLEVRDLTVRYGSRLATWDVSLAVAPGEVLGLVGESGAGKSTVGRAVVRLLSEPGRVEAGAIRFRGRDLLGLSEAEMRRLRGADVTLIPQDPLSALNPVFRVGLQATDALRLHRGLSRAAATVEMVRLLGHLGLADPADVLRRFPHELSGGMRQRVLIAMAFSCEPSLVIADEPTTALDVTTQAQILRLLETPGRAAVATLFVTHDLGVVAHFAHRVAVMYAGCLVETAPTAALFAAPAHPYTRGLLAQVPRADVRTVASPVPEGLMPIPARPAPARSGPLPRRLAVATRRCRPRPLARAASSPATPTAHRMRDAGGPAPARPQPRPSNGQEVKKSGLD